MGGKNKTHKTRGYQMVHIIRRGNLSGEERNVIIILIYLHPFRESQWTRSRRGRGGRRRRFCAILHANTTILIGNDILKRLLEHLLGPSPLISHKP